ncbi:serine/threonine-protein kinase [Natranaerovirga pectinivora]|uniref:non-specific serine/threonine protein kinase n=1 Tax=Natranaerovirga pectinivora TaxID=682400 RepID=A0A4R3MRW6_9FIRM|nr:Stk1 family PASTA domain-containing Ser/Thr kinase [Natranaerovirga pectinivora]TCT16948.1 serine/threonine-protein kinase [Natranaerovirga pectinivora]
MLQQGILLNDRYEIVEKIGSGGMSEVYKAKCTMLNRYVAIKVLKDEFRLDESFVSKFKVEAQSAASLSHQSIVNIYDVGHDKNVYYIVMELIEGITLKEYIKEKGSLSTEETINLAIQVASGIEHAHKNHIIHRDIKPQNIIISSNGVAKVTDFGIARAASSVTIAAANVVGSVHYISPEQARGGYTDEKSDLYSLGISMYEMITGKVPFEGDSNISVALSHIQDELVKPSSINPNISSSLENIILKATQKKTELRYNSMTEIILDLKKAMEVPNGDFVKIDTVTDSNTIFISEEDVKRIRSVSRDVDEFQNDDEIVSNKPNKIIDKLIIASGVVLAMLLVGVITFFGINYLQDRFVPKEVTVPLIKGLTEEEASKVLSDSNLGLNIIRYEFSEDVENGHIITQAPEADTLVREEAVINVIISKGVQTFGVPNVINQRFNDAERFVLQENLTPKIELEYNDTLPIGVVIRQEPVSGTQLRVGEIVTIYVSNGRAPRFTTVPDLRGLTEEQAKQRLIDNNLQLGNNTTYVESQAYREGEVISQTVASGETVEEGYVIDIVVSTGITIRYFEQVLVLNDVLAEDQEEAMIRIDLKQGNNISTIFGEKAVYKEDFPINITVRGEEGTGELILYINGEQQRDPWPISFKEEVN